MHSTNGSGFGERPNAKAVRPDAAGGRSFSPSRGSDHAKSLPTQHFRSRNACYPALENHFQSQKQARKVCPAFAGCAPHPFRPIRDGVPRVPGGASPHQHTPGCQRRESATNVHCGAEHLARSLPQPILDVLSENPVQLQKGCTPARRALRCCCLLTRVG